MLPGYIGNNNSPNNRGNISNNNSVNMPNNPQGPNAPRFRRMNAFNQESAIEEYGEKLFDQLSRKYETILDSKIRTTGLQQLAQLNSKTNMDFVNAKDEVLASWRVSLPAPLDADDFDINAIEKRAFKESAERMMPPDVYMNYVRRNLKAAKEAAKRDPHKIHPAPFSYVPAEEASTGCIAGKGKSCTIMGGRRKTIKKQRGGICPCALGAQQGGKTNAKIVAIEEAEEIMNRYGCGQYNENNVQICINKLNSMMVDINRYNISNREQYSADYDRLFELYAQIKDMEGGSKKGGGCGCSASKVSLTNLYGGYRATRKDKQLYKKYKKGLSIGFTGRSSLKAKGILPRSNGRYILGPKYSGTGKPKVLKKATKTRKANRR